MTNSYIPTGYHYVVTTASGEFTVELGLDRDPIRVDGVDIGRLVAAGSCDTAACIRLALQHVEPETDWSEGGEAWDEMGYEGRDGALSTRLPDGQIGETAEEWYDALGYGTEQEVDGDLRQGTHPVCDMADVPTYEPADAVERDLLDYAVDAREAALAIRASIDEAIEAWRRRDVEGVLSALTDARRRELDYGDDPSTEAARRALLGDGWTVDHRGALVRR